LDITVQVSEPGCVQLNFAVRDQGIGMTDEQVQKIFGAFSQADTSVTRKYGGTGLGLAISKNLVELMGGELHVKSELGVGSTFEFAIWLDVSEQSLVASSPVESLFGEDDLRGINVLIAEDNPINQQIVIELLESVGVNVTLADNGQEVLDLLATAADPLPWSLVLMDIQMPILDGHQATVKIRSQARYANLPVIAMTAHAMQEERDRCKAEGMVDHLTKPIDPDTLYHCVLKWSGRAVSKPVATEVKPAVAFLNVTIAGLDKVAGLRYVGGNPKLYISILKKFVAGYGETAAQIRGLMVTDKEAAQRLAHTLKGVAASIGAAPLSTASAAVEQAFRDSASAAEMTEPLQQLEQQLTALITELEQGLRAAAEM
jgi:CheY-like chemotaxis protein